MHLLGVIRMPVADRDDLRLNGRKPRREVAAIVLYQKSYEPFV
jgi:hypothetical protein